MEAGMLGGLEAWRLGGLESGSSRWSLSVDPVRLQIRFPHMSYSSLEVAWRLGSWEDWRRGGLEAWSLGLQALAWWIIDCLLVWPRGDCFRFFRGLFGGKVWCRKTCFCA